MASVVATKPIGSPQRLPLSLQRFRAEVKFYRKKGGEMTENDKIFYLKWEQMAFYGSPLLQSRQQHKFAVQYSSRNG